MEKLNKFLHKIFSVFDRESKWVSIVLPMFILGAILFLLTMNNVFTKTYDIERFDRAKETIRSPITIEDEAETERKIRETVQSVTDKYIILEEITDERLNYIEEIYEAVEKVNKQENSAKNESKDGETSTEEKVQQLKEILSDEIIGSLRDNVFYELFTIESNNLNKSKNQLIKSTIPVLEKGVRIENIYSAKEEAKTEIKYSTLEENTKEVIKDLIDFIIVENSFFDVEKTMEARKEAVSKVEPVLIRAGDVIVREEQVITNELYEQMRLVGLLKQEKKAFPIVGLFLFVTIIVSIISYEMFRLQQRNSLGKGEILTILITSIFVMVLMKIGSLFTDQINQLYLIVPVATGSLLIKQFIHERLSIILAILYAFIGTLMFNGEIPGSLNMEAGLYFYFFQMAGIILLRNFNDRSAIVKAGLGMTLVNILTILIFILFSFEKYSLKDLLLQSSFGVVAAFLSVVLTIGLLPFFESGLGILTDSRLITLANPNQPLLKKILIEAPGTYHHSVMVANLSEQACVAIGANGLLARVGSYYHDIGKTVNPHYFIENQIAIRNPHDFLEPERSAEVIINHVIDGGKMLEEEKFPKEIIDICLQHHGTTVVSYFYHKAKEINSEIEESLFRYPGPKPQTKEAGIICICDSVEAAVRSLQEPTEEKIEEIVSNIVNARVMDGQLEETPLTLNELKVIQETICETLKGIFHSRIQYPNEEAN